MSDDKSKVGSPDNIRIDINDPSEVRNWCSSLGCTQGALILAVNAVGTYASDVRKYLS
ncbi:DUF3606 domain-containing protein [Marinomonas posidonica]|uniref:DUF3606 domain-containing protein n=1 Tax=Marinomonas posidonica TaxID=936476 RepID=UPI003735F610